VKRAVNEESIRASGGGGPLIVRLVTNRRNDMMTSCATDRVVVGFLSEISLL